MALRSGEETDEFRAAKQLYSKSLTGIIEAIFGSRSDNEEVLDVSEGEELQEEEFKLPSCEKLLEFLGVKFAGCTLEQPTFRYKGGCVAIPKDLRFRKPIKTAYLHKIKGPKDSKNMDFYFYGKGVLETLGKAHKPVVDLIEPVVDLENKNDTYVDNILEGEWFLNELFGKGKLKSSKIIFEGIFWKSCRNGPGVLTSSPLIEAKNIGKLFGKNGVAKIVKSEEEIKEDPSNSHK